MALPANVQAQMNILNAAINRLVQDRERLNAAFEDNLGGSVWGLLSAQNQGVFKTAIVNDMASARDQITSVVNALAGM